VSPHFNGSDACEIFFSKIGGIVGLEHTYNFHELISMANTINCLVSLEYLMAWNLDISIIRWKCLGVFRSSCRSEVRSNLGDYSEIAIDYMVVVALKEGFKEAKNFFKS